MFYLQSKYKVKSVLLHYNIIQNSIIYMEKQTMTPEDLILYAKIGCMRLKRVLLRMIIWDIIQQKK